MSDYLKVIASILITVIMALMLSKQNQEISLLLTLCVSCLVIAIMVSYLQPIINFAERLIAIGNLNKELLALLFRVVGVCLLSQITGFVCADAGNQTLNKVLQIMTSVIILYISLPMLEELVSLIEKVMGDI